MSLCGTGCGWSLLYMGAERGETHILIGMHCLCESVVGSNNLKNGDITFFSEGAARSWRYHTARSANSCLRT